MRKRAVVIRLSFVIGKKVILVNGNFSEFRVHLAAGSDKGIKKGAGEVAVCHFGIFGYLQ